MQFLAIYHVQRAGCDLVGDCNSPGLVPTFSPLRKQPKPTSAPESADIAKLAEVVQGLTHQVQHLAMILDEVREDLVWAVRNDKFHCAGHSQQYVASYTAPPPDPVDQETKDTDESPPKARKSAAAPKQTLFE